jgi:hypothetical protein
MITIETPIPFISLIMSYLKAPSATPRARPMSRDLSIQQNSLLMPLKISTCAILQIPNFSSNHHGCPRLCSLRPG